MKHKAEIWMVQRTWEITDWRQLRTLIPSEIEGPDDPYASADWVLLLQRGLPLEPTQDSCIRVDGFKIPNDTCYVFPVIWNDKIWHRAGGWNRCDYYHPKDSTPIPDRDGEEWELITVYNPTTDYDNYPELPFKWLKGKPSDYELDVS